MLILFSRKNMSFLKYYTVSILSWFLLLFLLTWGLFQRCIRKGSDLTYSQASFMQILQSTIQRINVN